jgi:NlpC/P60 family
MPPAARAGNVPSGRLIASDALGYAGASYVFGGRGDRPGDWDCSSFVSYVLGHDFGMILPGGGRYGDPAYPPHYHGPVVTAYAGWAGAAPLPAGQRPAAGDLCIWNGIGANGHIGIAVDATTMISALNHVSGTVHTPITGYGPAGVSVEFRRIAEVGQQPGVSGAGNASDLVFAILAGASIPVIMSAVILGLAALGGIAAAAVALWAVTRGGSGS